MKPTIGLDTSSLVSLGHTDLMGRILDIYQITISEGVLEELKEIVTQNDKTALAANKWLESLGSLRVVKCEHYDEAEYGMLSICEKENILLFIDDIRCIKRYQGPVTCLFSVHLIYSLYRRGIISSERALLAISEMKRHRDWKENLIFLTARSLFTE